MTEEQIIEGVLTRLIQKLKDRSKKASNQDDEPSEDEEWQKEKEEFKQVIQGLEDTTADLRKAYQNYASGGQTRWGKLQRQMKDVEQKVKDLS